MSLELVQQFQTKLDSKFNGLEERFDNGFQKQLDAIDANTQVKAIGGARRASLASEIGESAEFKSFMQTGRGRIAIRVPDLQTKTAITATALGSYTSGVVMPDRLPGAVPAAVPTFRIRDLMRRIPTSAGYIDFVRVASYPSFTPSGRRARKPRRRSLSTLSPKRCGLSLTGFPRPNKVSRTSTN
jgi:hypothetical protein